MPKVKLIELLGSDYTPYNSDTYFTDHIFIPYIVDERPWEDIEDNDLNVLRDWVNRQNSSYNRKFIVVVDSTKCIKGTLKDELEKIKQEEAEYLERQRKQRESNKKNEAKRKALAEKQKLEKARKLLQEAGELKCCRPT